MSNELSNLSPLPGERRKRKRLGRGEGSGTGKTAGKGTKGQQARSGYSNRGGFEGGQMPLHRRLPKKGFTNIFAKQFTEVALERLSVFETGTTVTAELLLERGIISRIRKHGVKVLGNGDIGVALNVRVAKLTGSAAAKVVAAGGTVEDA